MPTSLEIVWRNPKSLKAHPLIRHLPQWSDEDERMISLVEDIRREGIREPLKITSEDKIGDGRHRWRAAIACGKELVPCMLVTDAEVASLAISMVIQRRHYTKGQRAFVVYPLLAPAHRDICAERERNLKAGGKASAAPTTVNALASSIGVGAELLRQAARLHEIFEGNEEIRDQFEPAILDDERPIGLGAALAGISSHNATAGRERPEVRDQDQLWLDGFRTFALRSVKVDPKRVAPFVKQLVHDLPDIEAIHHLQAVAEAIGSETTKRIRQLGGRNS